MKSAPQVLRVAAGELQTPGRLPAQPGLRKRCLNDRARLEGPLEGDGAGLGRPDA